MRKVAGSSVFKVIFSLNKNLPDSLKLLRNFIRQYIDIVTLITDYNKPSGINYSGKTHGRKTIKKMVKEVEYFLNNT